MDARKILAILNCGIWGNDAVLANSDKEHQTKKYDASVHHKQTPIQEL